MTKSLGLLAGICLGVTAALFPGVDSLAVEGVVGVLLSPEFVFVRGMVESGTESDPARGDILAGPCSRVVEGAVRSKRRRDASAFSALSVGRAVGVFSDHGVGRVIGVTGGTLGCEQLEQSHHPWCVPSKKVDLAGNDIQVPGIDAGGISAQVVQRESWGDRSDEMFVGKAMGQESFPPTRASRTGIYAIAMSVVRPCPLPASGFGVDENLGAEVLGEKVDVHSDLLFLGEVADRQFDDGRVVEAEWLC